MYTVTKANSAEEIFEIEKDVFPNEYWSKQSIEKDMISSIYLVCHAEGEIAGYITASYVLDEAELNRVAVKESYRCRGIATLLVKELIKILKSMNCKVLMLEVRSCNKNALNLYDSFGFTAYATRKNYYQNPLDDAVLMSVRI